MIHSDDKALMIPLIRGVHTKIVCCLGEKATRKFPGYGVGAQPHSEAKIAAFRVRLLIRENQFQIFARHGAP